jgi:hypothetical protein
MHECEASVTRARPPYLPLDPNRPIAPGASIQARKGVIDLATTVKKGGEVEHAQFSEGALEVTETETPLAARDVAAR